MLIKRQGISSSPTVPDAPSEAKEPFTHHLRRIGAFALVLLAFVGVLGVVRPPGVGATPVEGIEVTKPLWMFWWLFTLENKIGLKGILYGAGALFGLICGQMPRRYDLGVALLEGRLTRSFWLRVGLQRLDTATFLAGWGRVSVGAGKPRTGAREGPG